MLTKGGLFSARKIDTDDDDDYATYIPETTSTTEKYETTEPDVTTEPYETTEPTETTTEEPEM